MIGPRILAVVAIVSSIGLGVSLGVGLGERRAEARRPVGPPATMVPESVLLEALQLSPAEEREVSAIMREGRRRSDSLMRTLLGQVLKTTEGTRADIERVLSPSKRSALDSLLRAEGPRPRRRPAP